MEVRSDRASAQCSVTRYFVDDLSADGKRSTSHRSCSKRRSLNDLRVVASILPKELNVSNTPLDVQQRSACVYQLLCHTVLKFSGDT